MSTRVTRYSLRNNVENSPNTTKKQAASKRRQQKNSISSGNDDQSDSHESSKPPKVNVTPPKVRKTSEKQNTLSPSTLLRRLSLHEQNENEASLVNVPETPKSKIDNARKVLTTVETEDLYGREKELGELSEFLTTNAANKTSASIYISGQPGKH